jgi:hypothetical protein
LLRRRREPEKLCLGRGGGNPGAGLVELGGLLGSSTSSEDVKIEKLLMDIHRKDEL